MDRKDTYYVIGVMSGTSLDGLDIALCKFQLVDSVWKFAIERGVTFVYSCDWNSKLTKAATLSGYELMLLHNEFGQFIGEQIRFFLKEQKQAVDIIASHGHTIFHQPSLRLTLQIGSGAVIAASTGITTVCDFRTLDVALGGQGAPLVPLGDKLLFSNYGYCLNLGGFANISYDDDQGRRIAFDICPVNILLNHFANEKGLDFDLNGEIGRTGAVCEPLLEELNDLPYYHIVGPKSLGKEWAWEIMLPLLQSYSISTEDKMRTLYQHIAYQISKVLVVGQLKKNVLITGGGTFNRFLLELLRVQTHVALEIPEKNTIDFKEALIFAFLGLLRYRNEINCLTSVTGAGRNSISGAVYAMPS